ncbi:hypothetical protein P7K49_011828 [Saguinus oedipus]|uniref:Fas-binding factor 1 C-terminal domain-containing protein n=1 Tax=Saguinus oedipus TaxID=9490 RepID=A0ABQ9VRT8_SAGOE|nr:hypothetical protein P7K49_011828 [Saguinus oedipus]
MTDKTKELGKLRQCPEEERPGSKGCFKARPSTRSCCVWVVLLRVAVGLPLPPPHRASILEMRRDHEEQLQRLKLLKDREVNAATSATSHTRIIHQMEKFSSSLQELSSRMEASHLTTSQERELGIWQRDEQLRALQERLGQQQRDMEEERSWQQEVIGKMEARLSEQSRLLEQALSVAHLSTQGPPSQAPTTPCLLLTTASPSATLAALHSLTPQPSAALRAVPLPKPSRDLRVGLAPAGSSSWAESCRLGFGSASQAPLILCCFGKDESVA